MAAPLFADRADAGRRLAERLKGLKAERPLVLALPRGGVPVAEPVAEKLDAELDVLMVRKIGVPWQPELALGAVVDGAEPQTVLNEEVERMVGPDPAYLQEETSRQLQVIEHRRRLYRGDRPPAPVEGRTVVVIDDGIATGATVRAALKALRRQRPHRLIVATPVAPPDTLERLKKDADEVVCLASPPDFLAVGAHYRQFDQTADEEVRDILARHLAKGDRV